MRIARFLSNGIETFGLVRDSKVATRDDIVFLTGVPVSESIKSFFFDGWYGEIADKIGQLEYAHDLGEFELLAPIPNPGKIVCLAFNYTDHAKEQKMQAPADPVIVLKPRTALAGSGSEITCPDFVGQLDYEIELAVVIGRDCKNITAKEARGAVFGYMIFNDVSARDIQFMDGQFGRAKGFDTFAPCGPWITTADEIDDAQNLAMSTRVNGAIRQDSNTCNMSIIIPEIVSRLSRVMTLEKGDIISTGTPAGVALNNPGTEFLKDGDKIEMEIEGLGKLKNTVRFAG
ncbi:MAG: FAA hydrolase family protein [Nitrosopumilus sp. B06]|nr:MAG: FAA hydrolase family protein [Nitrosopumilus sp. B06]